MSAHCVLAILDGVGEDDLDVLWVAAVSATSRRSSGASVHLARRRSAATTFAASALSAAGRGTTDALEPDDVAERQVAVLAAPTRLPSSRGRGERGCTAR